MVFIMKWFDLSLSSYFCCELRSIGDKTAKREKEAKASVVAQASNRSCLHKPKETQVERIPGLHGEFEAIWRNLAKILS